ncbi:glycosyltransferase involved in cell wall biosynthesis [Epilithonimonas hungarica]|uniref:glycosyltransferase family 2 protein n=1 Tax=Epilithonimonas hungarica TaxID=454006 RepID=UPI00277ECD61|nr:glycosyltransferase family 2 protein [Epilithonimonas hungarica]MDP9956828.1 glycosyltransferase involved in cell wall biosynthesis [Epilithonimonas hungarica]
MISIVVPIYNVQKYLARCIESLINQSFREFEIILVDDGSPDDSILICEKYAKIDDRITIIRQKNKGLSGARNTGINYAKGDYICFIDSDDKVEPDMIENYYSIIQKFNPDIIVTNIYQYLKGNNELFELRNNLQYNKLLEEDEIMYGFIKPFYGGEIGIIPAAWNKCYKKSFIQENHLRFDESLKRSEDYWFNFYAFQKAKSVYPINKSFYHYYSNEGSMIRSFREGQFEQFLINRNKLIEAYDFPFEIEWVELNNQFVRNINELILLEFNVKGFFKTLPNLKKYLSNNDFLDIYRKSQRKEPHVKVIKRLLENNFVFLPIMIYYIWSLKAKYK